jgi:L-fuconate dehydratase
MGQVHQHLTFFTRIALGLPKLPLDMIPHLAEHFTEPCEIVGGRYRAPSAPGASSTIRDESIRRFGVPSTDDVTGLRSGR